MSDGVLPLVNTLNAPFWDGVAQGRLVLPHCVATGRAFWPPSSLSPFSGGQVEWRTVAPVGVLLARATYRRSFHKAFEALMPYAVGLVQLDCGPRLQTHIARPDDVSAPRDGHRVMLEFVRLVDVGAPVPVARKAD